MQTSIVPKANEWCEAGADLTTLDPKTKDIMATVFSNVQSTFNAAMQSCDEVAQIVLEIILGEKTNLRHQTNDKFGPGEIPAKLADRTGNTSVDIISKHYLGK